MIQEKKEAADTFKRTMRQLPSPVAIATASIGKERRGITIGSLTSLSIEPPLLSFNIDRDAQIHSLITRATHFAIHLPQPEHTYLCDHFSESGLSQVEQFNNINTFRSTYGNPVLHDIPNVLQCRSYNKLGIGDHTLIIGEVVQVDRSQKQDAVVYHNQSYRSITGTPEPKIKQVESVAS